MAVSLDNILYRQFSNAIILAYAVRMAKRPVVKFKLMFIGHSGPNCSAFYLYRATSVGLYNNPL